MAIYIVFILFICITAALFNLTKQRKEIFLIFWGICFFFLYISKDNSVGSDYIKYLNYFLSTNVNDWSFLLPDSTPYPNFERGYLTLIQIMSVISQTDFCFRFVIALIMTILPMVLINKYVKPVWMGVFLFFSISLFTNSFSMLRQTIAMYICWFSIPYIINRSFLKFLFIVLLAFLFHKTALVFIPVYFLFNVRLSFGYYSVATIATVVLYIVLMPLMTLLTEMLTLNDYTDADVSGGYVLLLFIAFCFIFCAIALRNNKDPYIHIFMHMLFLSFVLQILATRFNILTRIIDYYKISWLVLLPAAIFSPALRKYRIFIIFLFIPLFVYFFYKTNVANFVGIVPYIVG